MVTCTLAKSIAHLAHVSDKLVAKVNILNTQLDIDYLLAQIHEASQLVRILALLVKDEE